MNSSENKKAEVDISFGPTEWGKDKNNWDVGLAEDPARFIA